MPGCFDRRRVALPTWFTQYELSTRREPILRPTRSSATLFRLRVGFSCVMPWCTGLPYTMPCSTGRDRQRTGSQMGGASACHAIECRQQSRWLCRASAV